MRRGRRGATVAPARARAACRAPTAAAGGMRRVERSDGRGDRPNVEEAVALGQQVPVASARRGRGEARVERGPGGDVCMLRGGYVPALGEFGVRRGAATRRRDAKVVATFCTSQLEFTSSASSELAAMSARPHIVYMLVDNLGFGNVGYLRARSPAGIVAGGGDAGSTLWPSRRVTRQARIVEFCSPSRSSLLSGRLPGHVNITTTTRRCLARASRKR